MATKITATLNDFITGFIQKFDNQEQLDLWTSEDNQKAFEKLVSSLVNKKLKKLASKEEKEPRPKKGKTAYLFFCSAERGNMKKKYPALTNKEITKKLGEKWTSIKDDEDKIKIYKDMAEEDKERFEQEKSDMGKPKKNKKDDGGIKKNKSAYIFFCEEQRQVIKSENPEMKAKEIMSELGKRWKELDDKEKYKELAEKDKERYEEEKKNLPEGETDSDGEKEKKKRGRPKKVREEKQVKLPVEESDDEDDKPIKRKLKRKIVIEDSDDEGVEESKGDESSQENDDASTVVDVDVDVDEVDREREEKIAKIKTTPPMPFIKHFKSNNAGINMKELGALAKKSWSEMSVDEKIKFL